MKFFFCETCGKRLTDADLDSGKARDKQVKGVYCQDCAKGVMTMSFDAMNEAQAQAILKNQSPPKTVPVAAPAAPARQESRSKLAPARRTTPARPPEDRSRAAVIGIATGLGLGLMLVAILISNGSPKQTAKTETPAPSPPPPVPVPVAVPVAPPPAPPPPPVPATVPGNVETKTHHEAKSSDDPDETEPPTPPPDTSSFGKSMPNVDIPEDVKPLQAKVPTRNLLLWLRANMGVYLSDRGHVLRWEDQSGKGNHATREGKFETPKYRANSVNGLPAMEFTGNGNRMACANLVPAQNNDPRTFVMVVSDCRVPEAGNESWGVIGYGKRKTDTYYGIYTVFEGKQGWTVVYGGGNTTSPLPLVPDTQIVMTVYDGGTDRLYINGAEQGSRKLELKTGDIPLRLGPTNQYSKESFKGKVLEVLVYATALDANERGQVEAYLMKKYGMSKP